MARQSTNPALTRIPAFARGNNGAPAYPPPPTPPSSGPTPYGGPSGGIDYTRRDRAPGTDVGFDRPTPVGTDRMTIDDVIMKTGLMLGLIFLTGAVTWVADLEGLAFPAMFIGLGLGLFITFKQKTNPALILTYAAVEGVFLGGISKILGQSVVDGSVGEAGDGTAIVLQAIIGTAGVAGSMLFLYKSGRIRVTPRFQQMVIMATMGFFVLIMANLVYSLFSDSAGLRGGSIGIVIGMVGIALASMCLVLDFDLIEKAERQGVPREFAWLAAFGLVVTLVWLYTEILRLLYLFNSD